jgi:hypothetical protein
MQVRAFGWAYARYLVQVFDNSIGVADGTSIADDVRHIRVLRIGRGSSWA